MSKINVLSIGNSFSQDAQRYLHDLAKSEGVSLETVNLYIGGCSLETHFRNMKGEKKAYNLEINGHSAEGFYVSIKEALLARNWDYITLQQASHFSYKEDTYQPYAKLLADEIRVYCPRAKLLIHQTWGYESNSNRILEHGFTMYDEMFVKVKQCYDKMASEIQADGIIPSGAAFMNALKNGIEVIHRDTFHAKLGVGRFILALVWYKYITGNAIDQIHFCEFDEEIDPQSYRFAIEAVNQTFERPCQKM